MNTNHLLIILWHAYMSQRTRTSRRMWKLQFNRDKVQLFLWKGKWFHLWNGTTSLSDKPDRTYPRECVLLLLYQSTIKSATISIHFITISKCASSPPTTSTSSTILEFRKHCVGVSLQSLNWGDIQFIIHSFPLQYTYKKYQQQPF